MQQMEQAPLGAAVDPEVFRRVWGRVMAEGSDGPISVDAEGPARQKAGEPRKKSADGEGSREKVAGETGDEALLARALGQLGQGLGLAGGLARRGGRRGPALTALAADYRRAAQQLGAAYFLVSGKQRHMEGRRAAIQDVALGLRELFWWERRWSGDCLAAAEQAQDPFLAELFASLARTGQIHLGIIRGILEQMQAPSLDGGRGLE